MPDWFWFAVVFGYGAIVGSFLNVVIYRMPLGLPVSNPPSHCPRCNHYLKLWDNIPLLSFLFLGARCRYCRTPIGWRYFGVELLTACLWVALFANATGATLQNDTSFIPLIAWADFLFQALFASVLIALIFIDLDHFFVPDELNIVAFGFAFARDLICLGLVRFLPNDAAVAPLYSERLSWFGWLPRALPGAIVYGLTLYLVAFFGFIYYARGDNESFGSVARRFFTMEDLPEGEPTEQTAPTEAIMVAGLEETIGKPGEEIVPEEYEEDGPPIRLRFSPAFLAFVASVLLAPVAGVWSGSAFVLTFVFFVLLTPKVVGETFLQAVARFFRVSDLPMDASERMVVGDAHGKETMDLAPPGEPSPTTLRDDAASEASIGTTVDVTDEVLSSPSAAVSSATLTERSGGIGTTLISETPEFERMNEREKEAVLAQEADQFARESESGKWGGMGLGDAKLALAIGALLGPWMALLSLLVATFVGAIVGVLLARIHGRGLRYGLPFVPFMAFGAIVVMLYGNQMIGWYLRQTGLDRPAPPIAVRSFSDITPKPDGRP